MEEKIKNLNLPKALEDEIRRALERPSWESSNVGVHERVNFDDTIWGFQLAGGAYYKTPLRVTYVKEGSRAEHAGIKAGDVMKSINDLDTSMLTLQEAHDIILSSGIEIKLSLSAPDVEETTHFIYQDAFEEELREAKRRLKCEVKKETKPFTGAKVNDSWSCAWPCNKKRDVLYRESNCFLVPSRYEVKHPDKVLDLDIAKDQEKVILNSDENKNSLESKTTFNSDPILDEEDSCDDNSSPLSDHNNAILANCNISVKSEFYVESEPEQNKKSILVNCESELIKTGHGRDSVRNSTKNNSLNTQPQNESNFHNITCESNVDHTQAIDLDFESDNENNCQVTISNTASDCISAKTDCLPTVVNPDYSYKHTEQSGVVEPAMDCELSSENGKLELDGPTIGSELDLNQCEDEAIVEEPMVDYQLVKVDNRWRIVNND